MPKYVFVKTLKIETVRGALATWYSQHFTKSLALLVLLRQRFRNLVFHDPAPKQFHCQAVASFCALQNFLAYQALNCGLEFYRQHARAFARSECAQHGLLGFRTIAPRFVKGFGILAPGFWRRISCDE